MTIETLNKRIEGANKNIAKLEAKLDRILKAQATNWTVNPYYYREEDIKWTKRDLEVARNSLATYEAQLVSETEKANSRNVPAILNFLENWKKRVYSYNKGIINAHDEEEAYVDSLYDHSKPSWEQSKEYVDASYELYAKCHGYYEYREYRSPITGKKYRERVKVQDGDYEPIMNYLGEEGDAKLRKLLKIHAEAMYDDIIARSNRIVGQITDASDLRVGEKGELNGIVVGTNGKAKIQTISAGGYNIQCFHFRTLINEVRE